MKEHEELRNGKNVTVVEKDPPDLTPEEQQASLEARVVVLENDVAELKKALGKQGK